MTTESTIFKIKEGYILLEDLETWYSKGHITPEDQIQIYEDGGKRMGLYTIEFLIKIYGDQFPFRRVPRPFERDPLTAYTSEEDDEVSDSESRISSRPGSRKSLEQDFQGLRKTMGGAFGVRSEGSPNDYDGQGPALRTVGSAPSEQSPTRAVGGAFGSQKPINPAVQLPPRGVASGSQDTQLQYNAADSTPGAQRKRRPRVRKMQQNLNQTIDSRTDELLERPVVNLPVHGQEERIQYREYPLYNVTNEPEEERITGIEVIKEMSNLRALLPLNKWSSRQIDYFYFLNRHNYSDLGYSSMAICRLCNHTPYGGKLFFSHLFDYGHIKKLSELKVSRKSFLFWKDHIEKCHGSAAPPMVPPRGQARRRGAMATVEPTTTSSTVPSMEPTPAHSSSEFAKITHVFKTIPLFSSGTSSEKEHLDHSEISNLVDLFSKIDQSSWKDGDSFLSKFYESVHCSMYCDLCKDEVSHRTYKFTKHILSAQHLKALKRVAQREVNFWLNILNLELLTRNTKPSDVIKILTMRNSRPIPLVDFKLESAPLQKSFRSPKIEELKEAYKNIQKEKFAGTRGTILESSGTYLYQNVACFACDVPKNHFMSQVDMVDHIFSDKHVKYLLQFGFSEKAYLWWKKFFEDVSTKSPVQQRGTSEQPNTSFPISNAPQRGKSEEPTKSSQISNINQSPRGVTPKKNSFGNNPRVPLLDLPTGNYHRANQKDFCASMRLMKRNFQSSGKDHVETKTVNWNCDYCSTSNKVVNVTNELDAFNHITSQKHLEKMKFTGPSQDLDHWVKWALVGNIEKAPKVNAPPEVEKTPETQKMADKVLKESKFPPNVPRAPMLDKTSPYVNVYCHRKKFYSYLGNYNRRFQKCDKATIDKALAMRVNWICTYCEESENPIILSNMMYAFNHIVSMKHWENMKCTTSTEDLNYWKDWAREIFSDKAEEVQKTPEPESTRTGQLKSIGNILNNPRVPMLDELPPNEVPVTKERMNEVLDVSLKIFKNGGKPMLIAKTFIRPFVCSFCSGPGRKTTASTELDAFLHITKEKHREKMEYKASESDLQYWKNWVIKLDQKVKKDKVEVKETVKTVEEALNSPKTGTKNSRFPLLDLPTLPGSFIMSKAEYESRHSAIASKLKSLGSSKDTDEKVDLRCVFCPGSPQMTTIYEVMKHVFLSDHDKHINYQGTHYNFLYYDKLLQEMPKRLQNSVEPKKVDVNAVLFENPSIPKPATTGKSTQIVNPIRNAPPTTLDQSYCTFPLFRSNPTGRTVTISDTPCTGPTNIQAHYLLSYDSGALKHRSELAEPRICKQCGIDMSGWNDIQIANHAFQVRHLDKLIHSGVCIYKEDFSWWINKLRATFGVPSVLQTDSIPCYLGILQRSHHYTDPTYSIFESFNPTEKELIANVDEEMIRANSAALLRTYGGCTFCNHWNLSAIEVVRHYTSEKHFNQMRLYRRVYRADVDGIMKYVKLCQKEKAKCYIM